MTAEAAHRQEIADPLEVVPPKPWLGFIPHTSGTTEILQSGKVLAAIDAPGLFSSRGQRLLIAGRRFRRGKPDDAGLGEGLGNVLRGFFGMPRRRAVWRAGAGTATEICETSQSQEELSGNFELQGEPFYVRCVLQKGWLSREFDRRLHGPGGPLAVLEKSEFHRHRFILTPYRPTRLDALVIGLHLMFWLEESVGSAGAAGGAGGPSGGGGC